MKLIIQNNRVVGTATDDYAGSEQTIDAPPDFDPAQLTQYSVGEGGAITRAIPPVTMRQARLALLGAGLLGTVESGINDLPEPQKSAARIVWEYSGEVQRNNPVVAQLAATLGLSSAQIDALFIGAAAL